MITELEKIKKLLTESINVIDSALAENLEAIRDVPVMDMIDFCLMKEKDTTFNADFAYKMQRVMEKYNSLTKGQLHGLKKHYMLAKRWK